MVGSISCVVFVSNIQNICPVEMQTLLPVQKRTKTITNFRWSAVCCSIGIAATEKQRGAVDTENLYLILLGRDKAQQRPIENAKCAFLCHS